VGKHVSQDRRLRGPQLYYEGQLRFERLEAYYSVLSRLEPIRAELKAMWLEWLVAREHVSPKFRERLQGFANRWCLPADHGVSDVLWSFRVKHLSGGTAPLELQPVGRMFNRPQIGTAVGMPMAVKDGLTLFAQFKLPLIVPPTPEPFLYDPAIHSREWLLERADAVAARVREEIVDQAESLRAEAQQSGARPRGPRSTADDQWRMACRLALKVAGVDWSTIADWEYEALTDDPDVDPPESDAVRMSTVRWASELGIKLPK
jgi:hypothetical protein